MITDEQVKIAANVYINRPVNYPIPSGNITDMRDALEAYEQSKWVKFDINDPATYPQAGTHAFRYIVRTTNGVQKITIIAHWNGRYWFANQQDIDVTHWMPLPEYKGE